MRKVCQISCFLPVSLLFSAEFPGPKGRARGDATLKRKRKRDGDEIKARKVWHSVVAANLLLLGLLPELPVLYANSDPDGHRIKFKVGERVTVCHEQAEQTGNDIPAMVTRVLLQSRAKPPNMRFDMPLVRLSCHLVAFG